MRDGQRIGPPGPHGGIAFAGGGLGVHASPRVTPVRTELSGGGSVAVTSRVGVFGSIGHTIATADANGAGVTVIGGVSFLTGPIGSRP